MFTLALSPCPNDTFAFYGLLHGKTSWRTKLDVVYADIEHLNQLCLQRRPHFSKVSFGVYPLIRKHYTLLETGAALGFGCGPLVVAKRHIPVSALKHKTIAIPGKHTTASLLLKVLLGGDIETVEYSFEAIMPAVVRGEVDAGLIIHESRFTYAQHQLVSLIDLGDWWEKETGHAIPLGGIVARTGLDAEVVTAFELALGESIDYAWSHRAEVVPFMQAHAQEMAPEVMDRHVALYVNAFTRGLGAQGRAAIEFLIEEAGRVDS